MFQSHPLASKLLTQLAPAVVVTAVGLAMLSNLSKPVDIAPAEPAATAITTEAVFTPAPPRADDSEQSQAKPSGTARAAAKPKAAAPARKFASIEPAPLPEPVAPPLQIVPPEPERDTSVMGRIRGMGTTVRQMPQRAYATVTGWFAEEAPPRPPEPVPMRNFL